MDFETRARYRVIGIRDGGLREDFVASLIMAAVFFDGLHFFISGTALRGTIVGKIGEKAFRAVFSLLSVIGIVWLSQAYGQAEYVELWGQVQSLRLLALIVMLVAFLFVVLGITTPNPMAVGGEALLAANEPAKGIQRVTRHPFLCGVALWSLTHLSFNGDVASVVFFGAFLALALGGPSSIDRKRQKACGHAWDRFAALTSKVPFMAIIQGRNSLKVRELGWWRVILAFFLYSLFLHFHRLLFGVSPLPM